MSFQSLELEPRKSEDAPLVAPGDPLVARCFMRLRAASTASGGCTVASNFAAWIKDEQLQLAQLVAAVAAG